MTSTPASNWDNQKHKSWGNEKHNVMADPAAMAEHVESERGFLQNLVQRRDPDISFREIFLNDIEKLTIQLELDGFKVWFTCEVDGVEYRLAARKDAVWDSMLIRSDPWN